MESGGFALDEYITPRCDHYKTIVPGGTMPKATSNVGSMLAEVAKAAKVPGPEAYNKEFLNKPFTARSKGGTFSKLTREWGPSQPKSPSVGQYETETPATKPKLRGGMMAKTDRGCYFYDRAVKGSQWKPAPGKYDGDKPPAHKQSPSFASPRTESRDVAGRKAPTVGPGYYTPNYVPVEKKVAGFTSSKEETKSFLDRLTKEKEKVPAPGHNGIPESKVEDRLGKKMHSNMLLTDREVSPRVKYGHVI